MPSLTEEEGVRAVLERAAKGKGRLLRERPLFGRVLRTRFILLVLRVFVKAAPHSLIVD